jgi:hypothetical protein
MMYPVALWQAREVFDKRGGGEDGSLAARRELDSVLRALTGWPSGADYARIARHYAAAGREEDAALLRQVAGTDGLVAEAKTRWNQRYDHRPPSVGEKLARQLRVGGFIDFDPAGPYHGTDGALYGPGMLGNGLPETPVVVISSRGMSELVADWPSYADMSIWVASRGTTGSGELTPPPVPYPPRAWREEALLARLVSSPRDASRLAEGLSADTFTTDVRFDIYAAVISLARQGRGYTPERITAEIARQLTWVPDHALSHYGGPGAPWAHAFLARLADTVVSHKEAADAAAELRHEDERDRARVHAARSGPAPELSGIREMAARQRSTRPDASAPQLRPPDPPQDPGVGREPRM